MCDFKLCRKCDQQIPSSRLGLHLAKLCTKRYLSCSITFLLILSSKIVAQTTNGDITSREALNGLSLESVFGKFAKGAVYGGATFARLNNRILCPLLAQEPPSTADSTNNRSSNRQIGADHPILYSFNDPTNPARAYRLYPGDEITEEMLEEAQFDPSQMTLLFIHGWLGGIHKELWLSEAKNSALSQRHQQSQMASASPRSPAQRLRQRQHKQPLENEEQQHFRPNVVIVDWSDLAEGSLYTVTQNSFQVSRKLSKLLTQLTRVGKLRPELMHCFGHSIGAHICGQAARQAFGSTSSPEIDLTPKFGRITGLDPGGFCYELGIRNESTYLGLKPSDALIVDAYYSNRAPFGNKYQVGQFNVRLTNGFFQQACSVWRNSSIARDYFRAAAQFLFGQEGHNEVLTCDHYFATKFARQLLTDSSSNQHNEFSSLPSCSYVGYRCNSYRNFKRGKCGLCESPAQCYSMNFEYQREAPTVRHALRHLDYYANYSREATGAIRSGLQAEAEDLSKQVGGVPYGRRSVYYMRVAELEPYCGRTYRIRIQLDKQKMSARQIRSAATVKLHLIDKRGDQLKVIDANLEEPVVSIGLHGPWTSAETSAAELDKNGVDEATLTALIELSQAERIQDLALEVNSVLLVDAEKKLQEEAIQWIQLDYLSSANRKKPRANLFNWRPITE